MPETEYEDTGRVAQLHQFEPAAEAGVCLFRMAEGYVCGSPANANIHQAYRGDADA